MIRIYISQKVGSGTMRDPFSTVASKYDGVIGSSNVIHPTSGKWLSVVEASQEVHDAIIADGRSKPITELSDNISSLTSGFTRKLNTFSVAELAELRSTLGDVGIDLDALTVDSVGGLLRKIVENLLTAQNPNNTNFGEFNLMGVSI